MCGISGIVDFKTFEPKDGLLNRMLGLIRHRGPDAMGIYKDKFAGLASARLSILDIPGGDQPIHNEDSSIWVVFNGEIYNYLELREDLEKLGHRFYTQSDTEVLVHLFEEKGNELFSDLNGQFALALWDQSKETMLLARDRLGIRPLFYYQKRDLLVFSSEIKAIFAHPQIPRSLDLLTLSDIFTCWAPLGSLTAFEEIFSLLPGHYILFSHKGMDLHRYWQLSYSHPPKIEENPEILVEELNHLLQDSTRIRLRADVPVGTYLSGGLDSTYITFLAKMIYENRLTTFSVAFSDQHFDEASYQANAVQALKTDHRFITCTEKEIGEAFPLVIWHTEVPILRTAPAPLFLLSKFVRENAFKVILSGDGSDEIFAGYDIFKEDKVLRFWSRQPSSKTRPMLLGRLYSDIFNEETSRARLFLEHFFNQEIYQKDSPIYSHKIRWKNTSRIKAFFSSDLREDIKNETGLEERFTATLPKDFSEWDPLSRAQYAEISIFLSNYLLSSQGDRMAMAHSVEVRLPFLDHRVVQFACEVPPKFLLKGLQDKYILRKAAADLIPIEFSKRPKKPFRAPISACFLGRDKPDYVEELLSNKALRQSGYFDPQKVKRLMEKCQNHKGYLLSERENMALVGIISTQLLDYLFVRNFPPHPIEEPKRIRRFGSCNRDRNT